MSKDDTGEAMRHYSPSDKYITDIEFHIHEALKLLGITTHKFPETSGTPSRVIKMWMKEFFATIDEDFKDFFLSDNDKHIQEIIHFPNIRFVSCCAHHLLPFEGIAHLLYIPSQSLIGASKPARLIEHYSRRPQLQETLCDDVIEAFCGGVEPFGAMLVMYARHGCMSCRGVRQYQSGMGTSAVRGIFFREKELELKGYELIKISKGLL